MIKMLSFRRRTELIGGVVAYIVFTVTTMYLLPLVLIITGHTAPNEYFGSSLRNLRFFSGFIGGFVAGYIGGGRWWDGITNGTYAVCIGLVVFVLLVTLLKIAIAIIGDGVPAIYNILFVSGLLGLILAPMHLFGGMLAGVGGSALR